MKIIDKLGNISEYEGPKFTPDWNKILLIIFSLAYLFIFTWIGGWEGFLRMFCSLIIPFSCIWLSKSMGDYKGIGFSWPIRINKTTPSIIICIGGWIIYITFGCMLIYLTIHKLI